jgi:hypothetical protein
VDHIAIMLQDAAALKGQGHSGLWNVVHHQAHRCLDRIGEVVMAQVLRRDDAQAWPSEEAPEEHRQQALENTKDKQGLPY